MFKAMRTWCEQELKQQRRKGKPDRVVRKIHADSVEKIRGRQDSPEIMREKVRLADIPQ